MSSSTPRVLFVGNLPPQATPESVASFVSQTMGGTPVESVSLQLDPHGSGDKHRGYAFVSIDESVASRGLVALEGTMMEGSAVRAALTPAGTAMPPQRPVVLASSVRNTVDSLPTPHLYAVASEIKSLAERNHEQAKQLLLQYPMLAHALLRVEERLGMLQTQALPRELTASLQKGGVVINEPSASQISGSAAMQQQATSLEKTPTPSSAVMSSSSGPGLLQLPHVEPLTDPEEVAMLREMLAMTDEQVTGPEQAQAVGMARKAATWGMAAIAGLPEEERGDVLTLRAQLIATLGLTPPQ